MAASGGLAWVSVFSKLLQGTILYRIICRSNDGMLFEKERRRRKEGFQMQEDGFPLSPAPKAKDTASY
jgi:hypothetical protein